MPEPSLKLVEGFLVDVFQSGRTVIEASTLTGAIHGLSGLQGGRHG